VDAVLVALISATASLAGVAIGILSNRASERRQDRILAQAQQREDLSDRRRLAGLIADQFVRTIRGLRSLDEQYFEELLEEVFLPKQWYEKHEPDLLRLLGDVDDGDIRQGLTDVVTSLGDRGTHREGRTRYHYVESQLLLGLQIANTYGRGEDLDAGVLSELEELRRRKVSLNE
jgi:hypothetical protein